MQQHVTTNVLKKTKTSSYAHHCTALLYNLQPFDNQRCTAVALPHHFESGQSSTGDIAWSPKCGGMVGQNSPNISIFCQVLVGLPLGEGFWSLQHWLLTSIDYCLCNRHFSCYLFNSCLVSFKCFSCFKFSQSVSSNPGFGHREETRQAQGSAEREPPIFIFRVIRQGKSTRANGGGLGQQKRSMALGMFDFRWNPKSWFRVRFPVAWNHPR